MTIESYPASVNLRSRLRTANPVIVVTLIALVARATFVIVQESHPIFSLNFDASDSVLYRSLAGSLRAGDGFGIQGEPTAFVTPGFPVFLAFLYLFSKATIFIGLVHAVLGAITVGLIARLAFRLGGRTAAWGAGLFAAVYPHLVFWTGYVLTETLYVFFLVLALALTVKATDQASIKLAAIAGLAYGGAFLVRPLALGFSLLVGVVALLKLRFRRQGLVGMSVLLAIVSIWAVRNFIVLDAVVVTSTESGYVLWQGNSPGATGGTHGYVDDSDFEPLEFAPGLSEVERDRIYFQEATKWMTSNPGDALVLVPKKMWNMFRPTYEGASTTNTLVTLATYPLLMLGGLLGLWWNRRSPIGWLVGWFLLYHLVLHSAVTGMVRFRLPIEAVLLVPFGGFVSRLWTRKAT